MNVFKSSWRKTALAAFIVITVLGLPAWSAPPAKPPAEARLLEVLRSEAPPEAKSAACRQLAQVGTKEAVGALAALLADEKLSHMARYALEEIPDPAVDDALRDAATKLKGKLLAGVLTSIGARRDAKAVDLLAGLLRDSDAEVVSAAAFALGRIGTEPAAKAIQEVPASAPAAVKPALWDAAIRCADALAARGQRAEAVAIFDRLRAADVPLAIRVAATRGAVLARQSAGAGLLIELLHDKDRAMFHLAVRLAAELPGQDVTRALVAEIDGLAADRRLLLVQAMGTRGDGTAAPALRAAAKQGVPAIRIAAVRALARLGDVAGLGVLLDAAGAKEENVAAAAAAAIANLPGREVDAALLEQAAGSDAPKSVIAIDCLARRQTASAAPVLVKVARDGKPQVRLAALKALADVAGVADLPEMVPLLVTAQAVDERQAAERALIAICALAGDKDACAARLIEPLAAAGPQQKAALLRVLQSVRGAKALQAVRDALKDASAEVRDVAVNALCNWQAPQVAPDLLELARPDGTAQENHKLLALRAYIRLAYAADIPSPERLKMCEQALPLAARDEEKRLLLGALGGMAEAKALAMIVGTIDNAAVREEACAAAVAVAEKLAAKASAGDSAAAIVQAMQKVKQTSRDARCVQRANQLLKRLGAAAPKK